MSIVQLDEQEITARVATPIVAVTALHATGQYLVEQRGAGLATAPLIAEVRLPLGEVGRGAAHTAVESGEDVRLAILHHIVDHRTGAPTGPSGFHHPETNNTIALLPPRGPLAAFHIDLAIGGLHLGDEAVGVPDVGYAEATMAGDVLRLIVFDHAGLAIDQPGAELPMLLVVVRGKAAVHLFTLVVIHIERGIGRQFELVEIQFSGQRPLDSRRSRQMRSPLGRTSQRPEFSGVAFSSR